MKHIASFFLALTLVACSSSPEEPATTSSAPAKSSTTEASTDPKTKVKTQGDVTSEEREVDSTALDFLITLSDNEGKLPQFWKERILSKNSELAYFLTGDFNVNRAWYCRDEVFTTVLDYHTNVSMDQLLVTFYKGDIVDMMTITQSSDCDGELCHSETHNWLDDNLVEVTETDDFPGGRHTESKRQFEIMKNGDIIVPIRHIDVSTGSEVSFLEGFEVGKSIRYKDEGGIATTRLMRTGATDIAFEINTKEEYSSGHAELEAGSQPREMETPLGPVQMYVFKVMAEEYTLPCFHYIYIPSESNEGLPDQEWMLWKLEAECTNFQLIDNQTSWKY
ncbi:hypothetical protein [Phaeocystidibacter marisrubri]|uniref:Uncharacterized protein n=1 Tax=Phaeocystidibacter marisrubri TaxID=1577780 RepID=A0A6L3ZJJ0_9FLAO|nr:hypothetical protein [Phaeocystidibacter marisrubri]KAB2818051.1 hypothetical protein F8C82_06520 [Phaeocystidibacter marisrubri]GGH72200.1 hypothetical protein GCM10011318_15920 [Phaeocystidibacter marisrubri]